MAEPDRASAPAPDDGAVAALDLSAARALLRRDACAVALCDARGGVIWCNPALLDAVVAAAADVLGQPLTEVLGLGADDARQLQQALRDGTAAALPDMAWAKGPDGRRWWRAQGQGLSDGRLATTWLPLDEQRRQADESRRLAELLDLTQDFGRLGVWERDARTLQGRWDRHVHRFWGLSEQDPTPDFATATQSIVAEDRAALDQVFRRSIRQAGTYAQRFRVRAADGALRQLRSQWVVRAGADGAPQRVIGILVDDTESWNLARSYGETVEQLTLALELGDIVVWRHDLRSQSVHFSDRAFELLGLARPGADLSADEVRELVHPDDRDALRAAVERAVASGRPVDAETRFRHADGSWRHMLTRRVLQRDAQGAPLALLGVGLDLSERVQSAKRQTELARQFELTARAARALRLLRRADGRHGAAHRGSGAAPGQRARGAGHARRRHGHLGAGPADRAGLLGRADVAAARAAAARTGPERRRAHGAGAPRRPRARAAPAQRGAARAPGDELRVPRALARRAMALDRLAGDRGARCAGPVDAAHRRQLGCHRHAQRADRPRRARAGAAREPGQVAVPVAHEPRVAHAAERRAGLRAAAAERWREGVGRHAPAAPGADPHGRPASAVADRRRARPVQARRRGDCGPGQAGAAGRPGGRDPAAGRAPGPPAQGQVAQRRRRRRGPRRCHAPAPGAAEPADQRRQVQPRRRPRAGGGGTGRWRRQPARQRQRAA